MATKTKDSSGVGKEKKTSSSSTPTRSTKRSIMAPFISDKPVPNYMNPTISSLPESLKQAILNRPNLDRRRSFDKPPSRLPKLQKQPSPSRQGLVSPSHVPRGRSLKRSNTLPGKCRNIVPSIPNSDRRNSRKSSPTPIHEADSKRPIEEVINVVEIEGRNDDHEENSNNACEVEVERVEERPIEEVINVVETDEGRNDHEENSNNNASEVEVERVEENVSQLVPPQDVEQNQNPDIEDGDDHEKVIPPSPLVVFEEQEKIKDDDEHEKEEEQEKIKDDDDEHEKEEEQEKIKDDDEHEKEEVQEKIKNDEHEKEEEQEKIKDDEHEKEVEQEKIKDEEHEKEGECINEEINGSTTEGEVYEIKEEKEEGEVVNDDNIIVEEDQKKNEEEEETEGGTSEGVEVEGEEEEHVESSSEVEEVKVEEESTKPSKKETHSQVSNDVIEETASKLLEERKNKVRALAGAFQTVIDYQTK